MKKAQVTVYMIVGLVLVIILGLLFYFRGDILKKSIEEKQIEITSVPEQFKDIQKEIQDCTDKFVLDSIHRLGINAGYFYRDKLNVINYLGVNITYLHYGRTSYMPTNEIMQNELSKHINEDLLYYCKLTPEDIELNFGRISSSVRIDEKNILVNINWPIKLRKESLRSEINKISLNYPIRLGTIRNIVDLMIKQQIKDKPQLCLTCMARTAQENDLFVNTYNQDDAVIFIITDLKEVKDFDFYRFEYAGDYK